MYLPTDGVGTCAMLPREKQGVVDSKLKVYGTTNLRVADLSVVPLHIAGHPQGKHVSVPNISSLLIRVVHFSYRVCYRRKRHV